MKLVANWRAVLRRAWSVRLMLAAGLLSGAEIALPLLDGLLPIDEFADLFEIEEIPGAHKVFETLGGFLMAMLDDIPTAGDQLSWGKLRIEVLDMDGNRVDKVLVSTLEAAEKDETNG